MIISMFATDKEVRTGAGPDRQGQVYISRLQYFERWLLPREIGIRTVGSEVCTGASLDENTNKSDEYLTTQHLFSCLCQMGTRCIMLKSLGRDVILQEAIHKEQREHFII